MFDTPLNHKNTNGPSSYQSISTSTNDTTIDITNGVSPAGNSFSSCSSSCGTGVLAPMKNIIRRDRQYRRLVGMIFLVILVALSSLIYAALRPGDHYSAAGRHGENDDDSAFDVPVLDDEKEKRAEQAQTAQNALQMLNHHHHKQNRAMPNGCETTLVLLRHCEKDGTDSVDSDGNVHCDHLGYEHARYIATLFSAKISTVNTNETTTPARWPTPSYLYSLTDIRKRHKNYREWETLRPLADSIGIEIHLIPSDPLEFTQDTYIPMLQSGGLCGKVTVVAWKHTLFPDLANAVGCGPDQGCPISLSEDDYESVWQIQLVFFDPKFDNNNNNNGTAAFSSPSSTTDRQKQQRQWYVYGTVVSQGFDPLAFDSASYDGGQESSLVP